MGMTREIMGLVHRVAVIAANEFNNVTLKCVPGKFVLSLMKDAKMLPCMSSIFFLFLCTLRFNPPC